MKDKIFVLGFVILIAVFSLGSLLLPDRESSESENRRLAAFPPLSARSVASGSFMKEFETYSSDQFPFRDSWVDLRNTADIALGKKDNGQVYFGREGWLFAMETVEEKQLEANIHYLSEYFKKVKEDHPQLFLSLLPAPTSPEVASQYLPAFAQAALEEAYISQVFDALGDLAQVVDVTGKLRAAQQSGQDIYYKTDHHWTTLGAFYAYGIWARQTGLSPLSGKDYQVTTVSRDFYGTNDSKGGLFWTRPDEIQRFDALPPKGPAQVSMTIETGRPGKDAVKTFESLYDESYLEKKDQYSYFLSGNNPVTVIDTGLENGRIMLLVKDSYAHCFVPFLTAHYERIICVDLRYYKEGMGRFFEENEITDLMVLYNIIQLSNDRNLYYLK